MARSLILWSCEIYQSMCITKNSQFESIGWLSSWKWVSLDISFGCFLLLILSVLALCLCVCVLLFFYLVIIRSVRFRHEKLTIFHFGWRCIYQVHSLFFIWGRFIDWLFNDFPHWTSIASIALDRFLWWIYAHSQCDGAVVRHINRNALVVFHFYGNEDEIDNKLWQWPWQR